MCTLSGFFGENPFLQLIIKYKPHLYMVFDQLFEKYPLRFESCKRPGLREYKIKSKLFYFHHRQHRKLSTVSNYDVILSHNNDRDGRNQFMLSNCITHI